MVLIAIEKNKKRWGWGGNFTLNACRTALDFTLNMKSVKMELQVFINYQKQRRD